jgi:hypothetical protein
MVRQRISPAEYARYLQDPERPAFLQTLREHEIGGRPIPDLLDAITAEPLTGLRSIAAGLHGRAGKEPAPARGTTTGWAERAPQDASAEITASGAMMDTRQAELGRQLAARPPQWALERWGDPRTATPALLADWQRRAGIVAAYREAAGVTTEAYPIGPPPSGNAPVREAFHAAVTALALPDDAALLKAMGQGELEARVDEWDRKAAVALPDVQAEVSERKLAAADASARADIALGAGNPDAAAEHEHQAAEHAGELARLAVADAARREWLEANAGKQAAAAAAERELRGRGLAARIPVTDAEMAAAQEQPRDTPPIGPERAQEIRAAQTAELQAHRDAQAEKMARLTPVTDAELARYGAEASTEPAPKAGPEPGSFDAQVAELRAGVDRVGELVEQLPSREAEQQAEREAMAAEPGPSPQAEAEPSLEASWQPGEVTREPEADADAEAELEL